MSSVALPARLCTARSESARFYTPRAKVNAINSRRSITGRSPHESRRLCELRDDGDEYPVISPFDQRQRLRRRISRIRKARDRCCVARQRDAITFC
jgi:hypothetical protein